MFLRRWSRDRALAIPKFVFLQFRPELLGVRTAEEQPVSSRLQVIA